VNILVPHTIQDAKYNPVSLANVIMACENLSQEEQQHLNQQIKRYALISDNFFAKTNTGQIHLQLMDTN
jgi:hypothetical protein